MNRAAGLVSQPYDINGRDRSGQQSACRILNSLFRKVAEELPVPSGRKPSLGRVPSPLGRSQASGKRPLTTRMKCHRLRPQ